MKSNIQPLLIAALLFACFTKATAQDHYQVYVENASGFTVICEGRTEKGEGIFSKYTSSLKKQQGFLFGIEPLKGGLPKGVEGTIRFRLSDPKYPGYAEVYFDNPLVGSATFTITRAEFPFSVEQFPISQTGELVLRDYSVAIRLKVDTTTYNHLPVRPLTVSPGSIPPIIRFDWQVDQRMVDDEDNKQKNIQYFFSTDGSYAAVKRKSDEEDDMGMMVYLADGRTLIINEKQKTIMVMAMHKMIGEAGGMGKAIADGIKKKPFTGGKDDDDEEDMTAVKTGKTKTILGYAAAEYQLSSKKGKGTASFWYAKVPFDPVKVYTMGVGRPADLSKITNNPKLKNSIVAIPILNANYLWAETAMTGRKGMETLHIDKKATTINTGSYKVQYIGGMKDLMKRGGDN